MITIPHGRGRRYLKNQPDFRLGELGEKQVFIFWNIGSHILFGG
jgi:hypothetical protein